MKKGRIIFLLLFVVAVISAAVYTLQFLYAKEQAPEARYAVEATAMGDIMKKTVSSGSIVPRKEILIKPQISGIVSKVLIEAGEIVERGDLLAVVRVVPDMGQLSSAQSRLERARINQDDAQRSYNRQSMLKQNGVISAQDFEQAETFQRQAQEEFRAAEDNLPAQARPATPKFALQWRAWSSTFPSKWATPSSRQTPSTMAQP
jgi:HlyD family secretion protein